MACAVQEYIELTPYRDLSDIGETVVAAMVRANYMVSAGDRSLYTSPLFGKLVQDMRRRLPLDDMDT